MTTCDQEYLVTTGKDVGIIVRYATVHGRPAVTIHNVTTEDADRAFVFLRAEKKNNH